MPAFQELAARPKHECGRWFCSHGDKAKPRSVRYGASSLCVIFIATFGLGWPRLRITYIESRSLLRASTHLGRYVLLAFQVVARSARGASLMCQLEAQAPYLLSPDRLGKSCCNPLSSRRPLDISQYGREWGILYKVHRPPYLEPYPRSTDPNLEW
ncbi:hypothetical protein BOTBODRAFT_481509 [Botryobasidium botryosum FD-172 SS1]|uniref:Uncharacterized protein n=1 Tax=Botryobasidium botryosum (strain FD-172 SS1) TaxID=930990 RepID=A0A067MTT9_BOTB1|nr:hypothetical protein BOTBODRAFT_481509 [Botryobasidium botryosum FD-172 SS1]